MTRARRPSQFDLEFQQILFPLLRMPGRKIVEYLNQNQIKTKTGHDWTIGYLREYMYQRGITRTNRITTLRTRTLNKKEPEA